MLAALVPRLGGFASYPVLSSVPSTALRNFSAAAVTTDNSLQARQQVAAPLLLPSSAASPSLSLQPSFLQVVLEPLDGIDEGIFLLSLSRPAARNSIGRQVIIEANDVCLKLLAPLPASRLTELLSPHVQLLRELRECLYTVAQERTTRCVVVRSTVPRVFCAGADLKVRQLCWAVVQSLDCGTSCQLSSKTV